jgi:hypothetical protein
MRRTWLRGRENVHKRYLVHVAGHNLGILMRLLIGAGSPREAAAPALTYLLLIYTEQTVALILVLASDDGFAILVMAVADDPARSNGHFSNRLLTFGGTLVFQAEIDRHDNKAEDPRPRGFPGTSWGQAASPSVQVSW